MAEILRGSHECHWPRFDDNGVLDKPAIFVEDGDVLKHRRTRVGIRHRVLFYNSDNTCEITKKLLFTFTDWDLTAMFD